MDFSDTGFESAPLAANFAINLVTWLTKCGRTSNHKFHAFSDDFSLNGSGLSEVFSKQDYSYSTGTDNFDFSLNNLLNYDWIYLAGETGVTKERLNEVLTEYVNKGGNVYIATGTGNFSGTGESF